MVDKGQAHDDEHDHVDEQVQVEGRTRTKIVLMTKEFLKRLSKKLKLAVQGK
jgi:hypothetical protein